jgi:ferritin-like metal-binding protein YciE
MSNEKQERLLQWLRDAHAMEVEAENVLKSQASRLSHYPQLKARVELHVEETRTHAGLVRGCIERLGGSPSTMKDAGGKFMAMAQSIGGAMAGDEVVKSVLSGYAMEHMEIASYKILIAAAEELNDYSTKEVCERILVEEEAMAQWLLDHMAQITQEYLRRESHAEA